MDIQVRYTGSVEKSKNLPEKSNLTSFIFFIFHRKYGEKKMYRYAAIG